MRSSRKLRNQKGAQLIESAAAILLTLPLMIILLAVTIEMTSFILIKQTLAEAARHAARGCSLAYHWPPYGATTAPTGTLYSPDAQGDTVDPSTTSAQAPTTSPAVVGTSTSATASTQPTTANDAFARIRVTNMITSNAQFSAVYTPASVNASAQPQYQVGHVTVTVTSLPGIFPMPDPLNLKTLMPNFTISSSATYTL